MTAEILVVDDQPGIRLLLNDILTNDGYLVTTASNGREAIEKLTEKHYDLLLLDYKLPIIDGAQVIDIIEEKKINIPIIVMSGLPEKIEKEAAASPLVKLILAKPFNIQEISEAVKRNLLIFNDK